MAVRLIQTAGFGEVGMEPVDLLGMQGRETTDRDLRHQADVAVSKCFAGSHETAERLLIVGSHDAECLRGKLGVALEVVGE